MNNGNNRSDNLKLAYIIGTYPLLTTTFIDREIAVLRQQGVTVQIVSIRRPARQLSPEQEKLREGVICLLPVAWLSFIAAHLYFALLRPLAYWSLFFFLFTRSHSSLKLRLKTVLHFAEGVFAAYHLRGQACNHIHAHFIDRAATVALCASRLLQLPYSLTAHAFSIFTNPVLVYEKIAGSKFTVTVSEFNKSHFLREHPDLDPNKIFVLHPWVDLSQFKPPETRPTHSRFHMVSVGRLVEKKGHHYLIEACDLLQKEGVDFECCIIGDGPLRTELEEMVRRYDLGSRVHLLGGQPQSEVLSHLSRTDVFVLACIIAKDGDRDGMPVALAEAMAMEVPVISTDIVGIKELVQPGTGYLVPPNDAIALADAIRKIENVGASSRIDLGKYGRTVISEEFDLYKGTLQLLTLFQKSVDQNNLT